MIILNDHSPKTRLAIASDHAGFKLKQHLIQKLKEMSMPVDDLGTHDESSVDYPDFAIKVVEKILRGDVKQGILICGTGIGMSIAANRHRGIRAAVCLDGAPSAALARAHNNANILCLGERLMTSSQALEALKAFVTTPFEGGRHTRRLEKCDKG
ncbi:MAG: ribose 5-phosphate isomerase B [Alphaproteobacteria bacterium]|nr:ribose 5-phosphate isomerase B [Alphaproteobacteria bacterium]